jgi:AraC family transcriptional regulator
MNPNFKTISHIKIIGMNQNMSFADNRTAVLWKSFMPRRKEIINPVNNDLISMQVYDRDFDFNLPDPHRIFTKWAGIEVHNFDQVPDSMDTFVIPPGDYAIFIHRGSASTGIQTFQYIFGTWLPGSGYVVDSRPHFEVLGEKYKHEDPDSEEEIWIPVYKK